MKKITFKTNLSLSMIFCLLATSAFAQQSPYSIAPLKKSEPGKFSTSPSDQEALVTSENVNLRLDTPDPATLESYRVNIQPEWGDQVILPEQAQLAAEATSGIYEAVTASILKMA